MDITNELLAAYAEGHVSVEERDAVRKYLADNPSELESIMMMMDEDYEIEPMTEEECGGNLVDAISDMTVGALSAAAFAPASSVLGMAGVGIQALHHTRRHVETPSHADLGNFESRVDTLLGEIDSL